MKHLIKSSLVMSAFLSINAFAATSATTTNTASFTPQQTQAIQSIIHDYLVNNPQVLVEAADALQKQAQQKWQQTAASTVPQIAKQLFNSPISPVVGNSNGDVTMVEFFDYQCPHCKDMLPQVDDLLKNDKGLRVVYKDLPIFGEASEFAAEAGLAAEKQGKYLAFHEALLNTQDRLTDDTVLKTASLVGINTTQLQKDMQDPSIAQELQTNKDLAKKLQLIGTPAFVIAKVTIDNKTHEITTMKNPILIPGAVDEETLQEAIAQARGG